MRRCLVTCGIALYLFVTLVTTVGFIRGDVGQHRLSYFFVWDMFPGFHAEGVRRVALGQTRSGEWVQLIPSPHWQYRAGVHGDMTRADRDRPGTHFAPIARHSASLYNAQQPNDPIVTVHLYERYWPTKFNYPEEIYTTWAQQPKVQHTYWRKREEFSMPALISSRSHQP